MKKRFRMVGIPLLAIASMLKTVWFADRIFTGLCTVGTKRTAYTTISCRVVLREFGI